jgi:YVTN family beta-propeller protein
MISKQKFIQITLVSAALILMLVSSAGAAQFAYITNFQDNTVSVIDAVTLTVIATVPVGTAPDGAAVTPDGTKVYVTNSGSNTVSVIDAATTTVIATIPVGSTPVGVAVTPDGTKVYVANQGSNTVSIINTATNTVTTIPVGTAPTGVAVTPDGTKVYVTHKPLGHGQPGTVSVISTATNTVTVTITVGSRADGVAVTPDGTKVYVANQGDNTVSVINTATNTVTKTIPVGGVEPTGVAVSPDGGLVSVTNDGSNTVSYIATATDTLISTGLSQGSSPTGIAFAGLTAEGVEYMIENSGTDDVLAFNGPTSALIKVGKEPITFGKFIGPIITPSLQLEKIATPKTYDDDDVGQIITYTYTVTNNGNVNIAAPITVTDDKIGTISILSSGTLSPGSSVTGTATYKITDADIHVDSVTNLADATGSFSGEKITSPVNIVLVRHKHPKCDLWRDVYSGAIVPIDT